jgi:hypothetical protein
LGLSKFFDDVMICIDGPMANVFRFSEDKRELGNGQVRMATVIDLR